MFVAPQVPHDTLCDLFSPERDPPNKPFRGLVRTAPFDREQPLDHRPSLSSAGHMRIFITRVQKCSHIEATYTKAAADSSFASMPSGEAAFRGVEGSVRPVQRIR